MDQSPSVFPDQVTECDLRIGASGKTRRNRSAGKEQHCRCNENRGSPDGQDFPRTLIPGGKRQPEANGAEEREDSSAGIIHGQGSEHDRGPERRPERRPIATITGITVICLMGYLTYSGANAGSPTAIEMATPASVIAAGGTQLAEYEAGKKAVAQSGCLACHKIGENGNAGPGPNLTNIASRLPRQAIARTLVNPTAPMPSFKNLPPKKFEAIVGFLAQLKQ